MHLADGLISHGPAVAALNAAGYLGVGIALSRSLGERTRDIAWMGSLGAFVLVAQAVNLPVLPGISAHVIGASILTLALGPARAIVTLFAVLLVQALLLADGGLTVLGINALNIAVLPCLAVHAARRVFSLRTGAWLGTTLGNVAGATSLSLVLFLGAAAPATFTLVWLCSAQALSGLAEGVITAFAVERLTRRAPTLIAAAVASTPLPGLDGIPDARVGRKRALLTTWFFVTLTLTLFPLASRSPDALEHVVTALGIGR